VSVRSGAIAVPGSDIVAAPACSASTRRK